ncbi:MAG: hypothetical protein ACC662_10505, partial [Planctomycetota bacterium]
PVTGLEPGRTLQFTVQARRKGALGPLGLSVAGRVAGKDLPAPPADAIRLDGPATLDRAGATYLLTRDITTAGTAFRITAPGTTLDLGGHRVTYGTGAGQAHGVVAEYPGKGGPTVIRKGALVQGDGGGTASHAIYARGLFGARISYLDVTVHGRDASGIWLVESGDVRVDHCNVRCLTKVVLNRHYPGVTAIFVEQDDAGVEIDQNLVTASPQWGITVEGRSTKGDVLIHHNRVLGTKALVSNGYMIGVHKPKAEVFENELRGESRGIHLDGVDANGTDAWVHDNAIDFQDQPNPEYPDRHWAHGIKIEGARGARIERNRVTGVADAGHADVYALDVHVGPATGILVRDNRFEAFSRTPKLEARALNWTFGGSGAPPADILIEHNVFTATDKLVNHEWDGGSGGPCRENWWLPDPDAGRAPRFEHFLTGEGITSKGFRFLDPHTTLDLDAVGQWSGPGPYEATREGTLRVFARRGEAPVAGAKVEVLDRGGRRVLERTTDAAGLASGLLLQTLVTRGPTVTALGPFRVRVSAGGATWEGEVEGEGPRALVVDLATGKGGRDKSPPKAPGRVEAQGLSASRAWLRWGAAEDDTAVVAYEVYLDGRAVGFTRGTAFFVGGLAPATKYTPSVRAVDG